MSRPKPLIDENVRDAKHGQRIQLADGSYGTVMNHRFCHLNVDAGVYRKVVWIDESTLQHDPRAWLDLNITNTLTEGWYRTHMTDDHCPDENIEYYEV